MNRNRTNDLGRSINAELINKIFTSTTQEARKMQINLVRELCEIECSKIIKVVVLDQSSVCSTFNITAFDKENKEINFILKTDFSRCTNQNIKEPGLSLKFKDKTNNITYDSLSVESLLTSSEPDKRKFQLETFQMMTGLKLNKIIDVENNSFDNSSYLLNIHAINADNEDIHFTLQIVLPEEITKILN